MSSPAKRAGLTAAGLSAALLIAACGSSTSSTPASTASSSASATSSAGAQSLTVSDIDPSFGTLKALDPLAPEGKGNVAVILPDTTSSTRWVEFDAPYLKAAFAAAGLPSANLTVQNALGSDATQVSMAQSDITQGATVLIICPLDSGTGAHIEQLAKAAGVTVIDYDRLTLGGTRDYYVSFNNVRVGTVMGDGFTACVKAWNVKNPDVIVMQGAPTDNNATLFAQGYLGVLNPLFKAGAYKDISNPPGSWDPPTSLSEFQQQSTAHKNINAALIPNDANAAAIIHYLQGQGIQPKTFPTTGQDASLAGLQNILAGYQCGTVYKPIYLEAGATAALAMYLRAGQKPSAALVNGSVMDTTAKVSVPSVLATPKWVTTANMNDTVIADKFVPVNQLCTGQYASACQAAGIAGLPMADLKSSEDDIISAPQAGASAELLASSTGDYVRIWAERIRNGESGALPVMVGLIVIVIFFWIKTPAFMTPANLVNLMTQSAFIITLGMAEIFVLLLGDIDLAAGFTAACAAVISLWMLALGDPWWISVIVGLIAAAAYGALQGTITARLGLPSFVVTLAGQLGLSGLLLFLVNQTGSIGTGGVITLHDPVINAIEGSQLSDSWTWIVMIVIAVLGALGLFVGDFRRRSSGLVAPPVSITVLKMLAIVAACLVVAWVADLNRGRLIVIEGMPWAVLVVLAILVVWNVLLGRTRFGRYAYAIGGNAEAARRAGINVSRVRTLAFTLCGLTAGMTGIIYASYLGSISTGVNGGQNVLNAVAAAVIGGTSLFGGRGKMLHAVLGGLVVGVIYNGLELLGLSASAQLMWTALVLLAAVIVDRVTRQGRAT